MSTCTKNHHFPAFWVPPIMLFCSKCFLLPLFWFFLHYGKMYRLGSSFSSSSSVLKRFFWCSAWRVCLAATTTRLSPSTYCWLDMYSLPKSQHGTAGPRLGGNTTVEIMKCWCKGHCGICLWDCICVLPAEFLYGLIKLRIFQVQPFQYVTEHLIQTSQKDVRIVITNGWI